MSEPPSRPNTVLAMSPVLSADLFTPAHRKRLGELCIVPDIEPLASFEDPRADELLKGAEVLLTGWGCPRLDTEVLTRAPGLRVVVHAAGTVKNHVTEAVFERGIQVTSAAAANAVPVAEFTLAAILFANKRVFQLQRLYHQTRGFRLWSREAPGLGNFGKRIGLVGLSQVGRCTARLLEPFDLEVAAHDPTLPDDEIVELGLLPLGLDELLASSDVVSLHAPLLATTEGLLDARRLALMRDGSTLVNTARGGLVDGDALEAELVSGRIFAVLDTTQPEVLPADSPLYDLPNLYLTPHIAGSLGSETGRMLTLALDEIERYAHAEPLAHEVRQEDWNRIA